MYLRILILVALFSMELARRLFVPVMGLFVLGTAVGLLWAARRDAESGEVKSAKTAPNPLELSSAFFFAVIFVVMLAATHYAVVYLGRGGVYAIGGVDWVYGYRAFYFGIGEYGGDFHAVCAGGFCGDGGGG